jgi:acetyl-CoA C-acetyltransferase
VSAAGRLDALDDRRPVIVGVGRHTQRTHEGAEVLEPAAVLAAAARAALDDAAGGIGAVDSVRLVRCLSARTSRNAPLLVGALAGVRAREHVVVEGGGETPGAALARACADIAAGTHASVLVVAGEAWYSLTQAQRRGEALACTVQPDDTPAPAVHGALIEFVHPAEEALGIVRPIQEYPLFEQALRVHEGRSLAEHQDHLGRVVAGFSAAAQRNPYAWDRAVHTATAIASPDGGNRLVGFPYTKLMVSNEQVDMAAAMVVTSLAQARAWGVAPERLVFPLAAASGEAPLISERLDLHDSVLAREVGASIDARSPRPCADAAHVDLYSCFPSAVQIQARELGIADGRPLSLTGGMRFSGGPWCGYASQGFAAVVEAVRADPGSLGLVSANGGAISKLVVTLLSTEPTGAFSSASAQAAIDAHPRRAVDAAYDGPATVEAWTVLHGRGGVAERAVLACRTPDGARTWAVVDDPHVAGGLTAVELAGTTVHRGHDGTARL